MHSRFDALAPGRILVVDDDRRMASQRAEWLCSLGWHAFAAGSAAEALRSPGRVSAEACLVDAHLPDDGGRQVATAVRASAATAAVIAMVPADGLRPDWADAVVVSPGRDETMLAAIARGREAVTHRTASGSQPVVSVPGMIGSHPSLLHV